MRKRGVESFQLPVAACGCIAAVALCAALKIGRVEILASAVGCVCVFWCLKIRDTFFLLHTPLLYSFFAGAAFGFIRAAFGEYVIYIGAAELLAPVRAGFERTLANFIRAPERTLLVGMLIGGGAFSQELKRVFQMTGTSHLVAVSGMNVSFVAEFFERLALKLRVSRFVRFCFIVCALGAYVALTGGSASAVRAFLMALISAFATIIGRKSESFHALFASACIMILWDPLFIVDVGWQLSCLATLGLIMSEIIPVRIAAFVPTIFGLREAWVTTLSAILFTLPVIAATFGAISYIAPFVNVLIVPLVAPIMILGFFFGIAMICAPSAALFFAPIIEWPLNKIIAAFIFAASLPGAAAEIQFSIAAFIAWYVILSYAVIKLCLKRCAD